MNDTIVTIITVFLSLFAAILAAITTINNGKLEVRSNTIIARRIDILKEYQQNVADLYTVIQLPQKDQKREDLVRRIIVIRKILKDIYNKEKIMLAILDLLYEAQSTFIEKGDNKEYLKTAKNFRVLSDIYELAYWRYIIAQTKGRHYRVYDLDKYIVEVANEKLMQKDLDENEKELINKFIRA